jgi:hypothetical protein
MSADQIVKDLKFQIAWLMPGDTHLTLWRELLRFNLIPQSASIVQREYGGNGER